MFCKSTLLIAGFLLACGLMACSRESRDAMSPQTETADVRPSGPTSTLNKGALPIRPSPPGQQPVFTPCRIGGTPLASFGLAIDTVDVLLHYIDGDDIFVLTRWNTSGECRWIRLKPYVDAEFVGYDAEIILGTTMLYSVNLRYEIDRLSSVKLEERTSSDHLWVRAEILESGRIEESYRFNNAEISTVLREADPLDFDLDRLESEAIAGRNTTIEEILGVGSSLYTDDEGKRLVQLVEDPSFMTWLYSQYKTDELVFEAKLWGISDWFEACALLKCSFGFLGNPVCATCTVVSGGLLVTKAIVHLIDEDAWPDELG